MFLFFRFTLFKKRGIEQEKMAAETQTLNFGPEW